MNEETAVVAGEETDHDLHRLADDGCPHDGEKDKAEDEGKSKADVRHFPLASEQELAAYR